MTELAIAAHHIGKRYQIGGGEAYATLRGSLKRLLRREQKPAHTFWALNDISFEAKPGEVIGIIGRNGAGKSTLLKVLSRITAPSRGKIEIHGRIGCLLEVGTGFHPELSGRDNVFLNGAILGMKRAEIAALFDEIVAFAEVEKFIDTPVKHYSSGMYLRLAFAVAAHLQPEILIVDEVLAVGDQNFQKKCLEKMEDVSHRGRTILFVSHSMPAITRLCPRTILLDKGNVLADGPSADVVSAYLRGGHGTAAERTWEEGAPGNDIVKLRAARVVDSAGKVLDAADIRKPIGIQIEYDVLKPGHVLVPNFHFFNEEGVCAFVVSDTSAAAQTEPREPGRYTTTTWIPGNSLAEGTLLVDVAVSTMNPVVIHVHEKDAVAFQVVDGLQGGSARGNYAGPIPGIVRPMLEWSTEHR